MTQGTVIPFVETVQREFFGDWSDDDEIRISIINGDRQPRADDIAPKLSDYQEVKAGGTYQKGGRPIGRWGDLFERAGRNWRIRRGQSNLWRQSAANDTDACWALLYNSSQQDRPAFAYIDLGGPIDMSVADVSIEWKSDAICSFAAA